MNSDGLKPEATSTLSDGQPSDKAESPSDNGPAPLDPADTPVGGPTYGYNGNGEVIQITQTYKSPDGSTYTVTVNLVPVEDSNLSASPEQQLRAN